MLKTSTNTHITITNQAKVQRLQIDEAKFDAVEVSEQCDAVAQPNHYFIVGNSFHVNKDNAERIKELAQVLTDAANKYLAQ